MFSSTFDSSSIEVRAETHQDYSLVKAQAQRRETELSMEVQLLKEQVESLHIELINEVKRVRSQENSEWSERIQQMERHHASVVEELNAEIGKLTYLSKSFIFSSHYQR